MPIPTSITINFASEAQALRAAKALCAKFALPVTGPNAKLALRTWMNEVVREYERAQLEVEELGSS
jgi:hypothetical protein